MARPTRLLNEIELQQVEAMAGLALSLNQMAIILGISVASLDRRISDQEGVSEAIERGKAKASMSVRSTAFKMATSGNTPALTIFWLKAQDNWKETGIEPTKEDGPEVPINQSLWKFETEK